MPIIRFLDIMNDNYNGFDKSTIEAIEEGFKKFNNSFIENEDPKINDHLIYTFYNKCYNTYSSMLFSDEKLIIEVNELSIKNTQDIYDLSIKREETIKLFDEMMLIFFIEYLMPKIKNKSSIQNNKLAPMSFTRGIDNRIFEYYQDGTFDRYFNYIIELEKGNDIKNPVDQLKREDNINKGLDMLFEMGYEVNVTFNDFNIYDYGRGFIEQYRFLYNKILIRIFEGYIVKNNIESIDDINIIELLPSLKSDINKVRDIMYFIYKNAYLGKHDKSTLINELEDGINLLGMIKKVFLEENTYSLNSSISSCEKIIKIASKNYNSKLEFINSIGLLYINIYNNYMDKSFIRRMHLFRNDETILEGKTLEKINKIAKEKYNILSKELIDSSKEKLQEKIKKEEEQKKLIEDICVKLLYKNE